MLPVAWRDNIENEEVSEEKLKDFQSSNRRIGNSPALQLDQARISRQVSVLTGVYTTLMQQMETTKIEEVKKSDSMVVFESPEIPQARSKPNIKQMAFLAGFLGIGLGIVIGFVREYAENSDEEKQNKIGQAKLLIMKNITDFLPARIKKK